MRPRTLEDARLGRVPLYLVGNPDGFTREDTDPSKPRTVVDEATQELPQVNPANPTGVSGGRNWRDRVRLWDRVAERMNRADGSTLLLAQMYRAGYEDGMAEVRARLALEDEALHRAAAEAALRTIDRVDQWRAAR